MRRHGFRIVHGAGGAFPWGMSLDPADLEQRCVAALAAHGGDVAHGLEHVRRVVRNARELAAAEGARLDIVLPAAWLHDCVTVAKDSPRRALASRLAAVQAKQWLTLWGCDAARRAEIAHAIEAHSFSAGLAPRTLEARVVQDADRLDALGAVGLARCLMLGGAMNRPLYVEDDPFCVTRAPDDRAACIDHFHTKLLTLAGTMQTAGGMREARRRTEFLLLFLAELKREIGEE